MLLCLFVVDAKGEETLTKFSRTQSGNTYTYNFESTAENSAVTLTCVPPSGGKKLSANGNLKFEKGGTCPLTISSTTRYIKSVVFYWKDKPKNFDGSNFTAEENKGTFTFNVDEKTLTWTAPDDNTQAVTIVYNNTKSGAEATKIEVYYNEDEMPKVYAKSPQISPESGTTFRQNIDVTITPGEGNSYVVYTTDGTAPAVDSGGNATNGTKITTKTNISLTGDADITVAATGYADGVEPSTTSVTYKAVTDDDLAKLSEYDENRPIGWGASVTGSGYKGFGEGTPVNPILVTNSKELTAALQGDEPRTIYVQGEILYQGADTINGGRNKTVIGLPGAVLKSDLEGVELKLGMDVSKTGILCFAYCDNIILRNLTFAGPGSVDVSGKDNLTFHGSTNMWVDHCLIRDGIDGNFDIIHGSDKIAVTWCRFYYEKNNNHNTSNLIGHDDWNYVEDETHLNTTWGNCWWGSYVQSRTPRARYGKTHVYNCYFDNGSNQTIAAGYKAAIYADHNDFNGKTGDKTINTSNTGRKTYNSGDDGSSQYSYNYENNSVKDSQSKAGSVGYYTPEYSYKHVSSYSEVKGIVTDPYTGAGPTLFTQLPESYDTYIEPKVTIGSGKQWGTYASAYNLDFRGSGISAYTIADYVDDDDDLIYTLQLEKRDIVPAGTGVVVYGTAGTYYPEVTEETAEIADNMLVGTLTKTYIGLTGDIKAADSDINPNTPFKDLDYKDLDEDPSNGIQRCDGGYIDDDYYDYVLTSGVFKYSLPGHIAANKAYLHLPKTVRDNNTATGNSKAFRMVLNDTTGVTTIDKGIADADSFDNNWYTLQGMRIGKPVAPGIYVRNGKEVLVK